MTSPDPQLSFSSNEVAQHKTTDDIWVIIDQNVYDLSSFMDEHPGGSKSMYPTFFLKTYLLTWVSSLRCCWKGRDKELSKVSSG